MAISSRRLRGIKNRVVIIGLYSVMEILEQLLKEFLDYLGGALCDNFMGLRDLMEDID